jgi:uncharacterized membrane protein
MIDFLIRFAIAGVVMGLIDAVWLSVIATKFYKSEIGKLLLANPNMVAAVAFYIIYIIGVVMFVVNPALEKQSWQYAAGYGALFGLVAYATYDLTNLATLKNWSLKVVLVDMAWGAFLTAAVGLITYWIVSSWIS